MILQFKYIIVVVVYQTNFGRLESIFALSLNCNLASYTFNIKSPSCDVLGVHKRDHDVPCALGGVEALVIVGQPPRVHEHPAHPCVRHLAVVSQEPAVSSLKM